MDDFKPVSYTHLDVYKRQVCVIAYCTVTCSGYCTVCVIAYCTVTCSRYCTVCVIPYCTVTCIGYCTVCVLFFTIL